MRTKRTGGGWAAIWYSLRFARQVGWLSLFKAMTTRNACKTCALGMGGMKGGMVNEAGHWPEVCKKSFQAMAADMQGAIKDEFFQKYSIAQLRTFTPRELETAGRITKPLLLEPGATHYKPIEWEDALSRVAGAMKRVTPDESFFYVSGRSSNEAGFLVQLFARMAGVANISNCSFYCHQASGVGLTQSLGTSTATVTLEDLNDVDLFVLIGGNPASNHPRLMRTLMQIRRRGGNVIVVNPLREVGLVNFSVPSDVRSLLFGTKIASSVHQAAPRRRLRAAHRRRQGTARAKCTRTEVHRGSDRGLPRLQAVGRGDELGRHRRAVGRFARRDPSSSPTRM